MPRRLISDDGTSRVWEHTDASGKVIGSTVERYGLAVEPLTEHEQLATLLAVKGIITTDEAAAVTKRAKADLIAEAEAWAVAEQVEAVKG